MTHYTKYIFGLPNHGNTCYLNSAVQLLCLNPHFLEMENISDNPRNAIKKIKNSLSNISNRFSGFNQQDSGEALMLLLEEYGDKKNLNLLLDYEFTEITRVKCKLLRCLHKEISSRKSNILLLEINGACSLTECYLNLKKAVILKNDEAWKCPKCHVKLVASKRFYFDINSPYLIVGLKRFENRGSRFIKNNKDIEIPFNWYNNYKLQGAIIHSGSLNGGHYICVGKKNNNWYVFNDNNVSQITNKNMLNNYIKKAYFLVYKK
ncbi:putative ubiquitin carboxyl-terminal hydrolase [Cafeteria roenbergensis virus]|uniref:ubiquitinyl hydrolase 1 n=1 Tax=Cafeteria roenbergensis virus (strain BV-PW1) TaxID=693272 RepID=E3T5F7_CROVB|nr:putative ubiquitin carboxyl-terminal hydrolase [Cafeteria roenbergensis virus BV-PW1]ADO67420.1 putative ubiquitin carboxyl-terminal hydrolase [Cafeteria roenbergensis virus BV-PW1]